ncbi:type II toxin-antitoxin system VapC family toxin [Cysteiniphilum sp. QT6929]|uniref:type II toxin-antitoxin system VapC family toxin n=1 Tax=Cysteiniphilum sp. QT6929 TaxID=2975055 RepID=UPI0024B3709F|nr:type II toxin-antitoxin system VapC family toxin [Cysteiniphilum sp. QT6929]WHN64726.1 type II toxin-antitoxin system VapC family toxin [Cysteiniphilum sp. QT6929]
MILVDTNVISEPLKPRPNVSVIKWLDDQLIDALYLSTISIAEIRFGIAALPSGKKKTTLEESLESTILPLFTNRVLSFDQNAAKIYALSMAKARKCGITVGIADAYIAAIAKANSMTIATRDTNPFDALEVPYINPWEC